MANDTKVRFFKGTTAEVGARNVIDGQILFDTTTKELYVDNGTSRDKYGSGETSDSGTTDYAELDNKPKINNVTLSGNKSLADLGIEIPTNVGDLVNDAHYITSSSIPSNVSTFTNDSGYLTTSTLPTASSSTKGVMKVDNSTIKVNSSTGVASVPTGTTSALGVVKADGTTVKVNSGKLSVPTATGSALGLVRPDNTTITITNGVISSVGGSGGSYTLPTASASTLGGVKVDNSTVKVDANGVLSAEYAEQLTYNGNQFYLDKQGDVWGFNTSADRGSSTFHPFNQGGEGGDDEPTAPDLLSYSEELYGDLIDTYGDGSYEYITEGQTTIVSNTLNNIPNLNYISSTDLSTYLTMVNTNHYTTINIPLAVDTTGLDIDYIKNNVKIYGSKMCVIRSITGDTIPTSPYISLDGATLGTTQLIATKKSDSSVLLNKTITTLNIPIANFKVGIDGGKYMDGSTSKDMSVLYTGYHIIYSKELFEHGGYEYVLDPHETTFSPSVYCNSMFDDLREIIGVRDMSSTYYTSIDEDVELNINFAISANRAFKYSSYDRLNENSSISCQVDSTIFSSADGLAMNGYGAISECLIALGKDGYYFVNVNNTNPVNMMFTDWPRNFKRTSSGGNYRLLYSDIKIDNGGTTNYLYHKQFDTYILEFGKEIANIQTGRLIHVGNYNLSRNIGVGNGSNIDVMPAQDNGLPAIYVYLTSEQLEAIDSEFHISDIIGATPTWEDINFGNVKDVAYNNNEWIPYSDYVAEMQNISSQIGAVIGSTSGSTKKLYEAVKSVSDSVVDGNPMHLLSSATEDNIYDITSMDSMLYPSVGWVDMFDEETGDYIDSKMSIAIPIHCMGIIGVPLLNASIKSNQYIYDYVEEQGEYVDNCIMCVYGRLSFTAEIPMFVNECETVLVYVDGKGGFIDL